ncbi:aminopeptidase N [Yimella sp. RIT 621]|nr:aminopeptidase N [Yimella sp. RIT 621]
MFDSGSVTSDLNLTRQECDARGDQLKVRTYRVELDLSEAATDAETYRSRSTVVFDSTGTSTWIDLVTDVIDSVTVNGRQVYLEDYDGARILLRDLEIGENTVVVDALCKYSRTGEGLHRFTDPEDGNTYLYTHCEPTDARRMFACFEQPDLKGEFTFVVTAPSQWLVRSNQPEVSTEPAGQCTTHTFAPTPPLSSYIVALIAGPYAVVQDTWSVERADGSSQTIELTAMCRRGMLEHLESDEIFYTTKAGLDFYDRAYGFPYPWGGSSYGAPVKYRSEGRAENFVGCKYDQVFVPEYNIGAMENPGLVTFTEDYLFRGGATTMQRTSRAGVILHEMAHMWFGDLVTPKWWDDLWLKESFADLMGYQVTQEATRFDQAWLQFASGRKLWAYTYDQLPSTHPVIARIDDLEAAAQNFDGITYSKGAAVLRQLQAIIGPESFFAGARDYFAAHAFGSATFNDLLTALQPHTEHDLWRWADAWLRTTSPSELTADTSRGHGGAVTELVVRQRCTDRITGDDVVRPHQLQVAGYALGEAGLERTFLAPVTLTDESVEVPEAVGNRADLVLVNAGDLTYGIGRLDEQSQRVASTHLSSITDDLDRGAVWTALWNLTRDARIPASRFVDTFCTQAPAESNAMILRIVAGQVQTAVGHFLPAGTRAAAWDALGGVARVALAGAEPESDLQRTWADLLAEFASQTDTLAGDAAALADGKVPDGLTLTDELRWKLAASLVRQGAWDEAQVQQLLEQDNTLIGRTSSLTALAAAPQAQDETWRRLVEDELTNDAQRALLSGWGISDPGTKYAQPYVELLDSVWGDRVQSMAQRLVIGLFPDVDADDEGRAALGAIRSWYDDNPGSPAALRRIVLEQIDHAERALRAQQVTQD